LLRQRSGLAGWSGEGVNATWSDFSLLLGDVHAAWSKGEQRAGHDEQTDATDQTDVGQGGGEGVL
jgi:hypothetical protein